MSENKNNRVLVLMDFDGTISKADSFFDFIFFSVSIFKILRALLLLFPLSILYLFRQMTKSQIKEKVIAVCFKNISESTMESWGEKYCATRINQILRKDALAKIATYKKEGATICIVSASSKFWLMSWCNQIGASLISTDYEVSNGVLTGCYRSTNCVGEEKVKRILEAYDLSLFNEIHCYGDTKNDMPMLALGTQQYYKYFT